MAKKEDLKIVPLNWAHVGIAVGATVVLYFLVAIFLFRSIPGIKDSWLARIAADQQNVNLGSYIAFSVAIALLLNRWRIVGRQRYWITSEELLQAEHQLVIESDGLELRRKLMDLSEDARNSIPVQMLDAGLQQSRVSWSPSSVTDAIKTRTDTIQGQVDAEYSIIKYLIWAIPSIGFCGTVYGLGAAIGSMRDIPGVEISDDEKMQNAIGSLFTAFDTTLVALILSILLMLVYHIVQAKEDSFIVNSFDWNVRRFALRMHESEGAV